MRTRAAVTAVLLSACSAACFATSSIAYPVIGVHEVPALAALGGVVVVADIAT